MTSNQKTGIGIAALIGLAWWLGRNRPLTATVTTSEGYDLTPYGGPLTVPEPVQRLGAAIARAEGFYVAGSLPDRAHNPGDLKVPDAGKPTINGITVFESDAEGWQALYRQLMLIVSGQSAYYTLDDTIWTMAQTWTATEPEAWASNVASNLGVDTSTPLWQVIA